MSGKTRTNWKPNTNKDILFDRAKMYSRIRNYFTVHEILEVETPILSSVANTHISIDLFSTYLININETNKLMYLQSSPESAMKRLIADGLGPIYQICKVFRNGEISNIHNPEFTMLEWYEPKIDYLELMNKVQHFLNTIFGIELNFRRLNYRDLIHSEIGIDPYNVTLRELKNILKTNNFSCNGIISKESGLERLFDKLVLPNLRNNDPLIIYNYPKEMACQAKINNLSSPYAERFEIFMDNIEIANGYTEITDSKELLERFHGNNKLRKESDKKEQPIDDFLLSSIQSGFPLCSGIAIGLDRLFMVSMNRSKLNQVIPFSIENM